MELELSPLASNIVQEAWREERVCVWGWGRGSWGEEGTYDPAAFAGRGFLSLPCAGLKAKRVSPLCGIPRARELL